MEMQEVAFASIEPFVGAAVKDGVSMGNPATARWFAVMDAGEVVAFSSILPISIGFRIRSSYVKPSHRGRGLYHLMMEHCLTICEQACASVEVLVDDLEPYWLKRGFKVVSRSKSGIARMVKLY